MKSSKPIIIQVGQLYYDEQKNEYLTITKNMHDSVSYQGIGFRGMLETEKFLTRFQPVNPIDVSFEDLTDLMGFCPEGTKPKTGFITE